MKKVILISLLTLLLSTAFKLIDEPNPILGRWEYKGVYQGQPYSFLVVFRNNGNYDGFLDKKIFVSGTYQMKHDTLHVADPLCNNDYYGTYKVQYHGQMDSLTLHVVQDTCRARREGSDGFTFKRVNTKR
ncbi:hypothetical protein ACSBL2_15510 [Pedobacter sp. AW31-3R]|uniref:hypothetical protein n=1 Tax=Pedobacter sp. AW31-3R TaxID=3445781 RepID=UPI003FA18D10